MQLTVRDVCRLMQVSEQTVRRWVKEQQLPAQNVAGKYHFNRSELFEWATLHKLPVPPELLDESPAAVGHEESLADSLARGGIFYHLPGDNIESALRAVVVRMPLPAKFDREMLLRLFLSRELLGSTAVGDGIAIPHPRYPVVLSVPEPRLSLCYLEHAIDFSASDGRPVDTLFVMVSPTARWHSRLLTQVARALADAEFRRLVAAKAPTDFIYQRARLFNLSGENDVKDNQGES
jgi:PTS system nitrogen regulatory IIA component